MAEPSKNIAADICDPDKPAVFIRASSVFASTIGQNMADILKNGLGVYDKLLEEGDTPYNRTLFFADSVDSFSQHVTEAVAGKACMGHIQEAMLNIFRRLPDCYLNQIAAETFEKQMAVQAHMLMALSSFWNEEATQEARDKLVQMNKHLGHWQDAIMETNASIVRLGEIEERFLDMAQKSAFGSFGTAGTGENPIVPILNEIRAECETLFNETRKAHILNDLLHESLTYYKASINKLAYTATPQKQVSQDVAPTAQPQPK